MSIAIHRTIKPQSRNTYSLSKRSIHSSRHNPDDEDYAHVNAFDTLLRDYEADRSVKLR